MLVAGGADFLDLEAELSGSDRSGDESDQGEVGTVGWSFRLWILEQMQKGHYG